MSLHTIKTICSKRALQLCTNHQFTKYTQLYNNTALTYNKHITLLQQPLRSFSFSYPAPRKLDDIVKLDKLNELTTTQLHNVWNEYHNSASNIEKNQYNISDVLDNDQYNTLMKRIKESPICIIPVITKLVNNDDNNTNTNPNNNSNNIEYWPALIQWQDNIALLTSVSSYQQANTQVIPTATITLYNDLLQHKQTILVRGDIVIPTDLNKIQFSKLYKLLLQLYLNDQHYNEYTYKANKKQNEFDFNDLLTTSIEHHNNSNNSKIQGS